MLHVLFLEYLSSTFVKICVFIIIILGSYINERV